MSPLTFSSHSAAVTPPSNAFAAVTGTLRMHAAGHRIQNKFGRHTFDTLVAVPGIEREGSIHLATEFWNSGTGDHLLIVGHNGSKHVQRALDQNVVADHFGITHRDGVQSMGFALHTADQAHWLAEKIAELRGGGIILFAPIFHATRFCLTMLEGLRRGMNPTGEYAKIPVILIPYVQAPLAPTLLNVGDERLYGESDNPLDYCNLTEAETVHGEFARIQAYQEQKSDGTPGDMLTTERFEAYLEWLIS